MGRRLISTLVLALGALLPVAAMAQQPGDDVPFTSLLMDASSSMTGARDEVIVDVERFRKVWDDVHRVNPEPPPLPQVDFSHSMVVVVSMGQQPTSNAAILIKRVLLVRGQADGYPLLLVQAVETRPGRKCIVLPSSSGPIHIIELPFYPDVSFQRIRKTYSCQ